MEGIMLVPVLLPPEAANIVATSKPDGSQGWKKLSFLKKHRSDTTLRSAPLVSPRPYFEGLCLVHEARCCRKSSCVECMQVQ